jgi:bifunctional isochorismate lyase/aryl carrier protein
MPIPLIAPYPTPGEADLAGDRVAWQADPRRAVLLVHDMQRYFVRAYTPGAAPLADVVPRIQRLVALARDLDVPVLFSAQPGDQAVEDRRLLTDFWGGGLSSAPEDTAIIDELAPQPGETVLTKWRYSAFQRTDLRAQLADLGRDQLLITGIYAHIGCLMTAAEAFMQDVEPFLVADATADFTREEHLMALRWAAGRCARTVTTAQVARQLTAAAAPAPVR